MRKRLLSQLEMMPLQIQLQLLQQTSSSLMEKMLMLSILMIIKEVNLN